MPHPLSWARACVGFAVAVPVYAGAGHRSVAGMAVGGRPFLAETIGFVAMLVVAVALGGAGVLIWIMRGRLRRLIESAARARAELRESQERFRLVVETSPSGMIIVDQLGRIAVVNAMAEKIFGYSRQELFGQSIGMILPGDHRSAEARFAPECPLGVGGGNGNGNGNGHGHARGAADVRQCRGRRADGQEVPVEVGSNAMDTPDGRFELLCVTDVSERVRAESQAAQLRSELAHLARVTMLGELSGSLAHELNQPLTSILSNAQAAEHFLEADRPDFQELREILKDIVAEDKRAGQVIQRLRALFRKGELQRQRTDVNELLQDVLKLARSDLIDRGVSVNVRLTPGLPAVTADRVQVQQVLLNLVKNGCDAMEGVDRAERRLEVTSAETPDGAGVLVSIRDRGCGVPPTDVERVFEPFVTTKSSGMGLGLAVCRTIVQGHDGRLWLENNAERGATVHLVIPAAGAGAEPPNDAPAARDACEAAVGGGGE